jgi:hypothetical protein
MHLEDDLINYVRTFVVCSWVAQSLQSVKEHECVDMAPGLHGARFSNSTKFDIFKFRKNSEKNS